MAKRLRTHHGALVVQRAKAAAGTGWALLGHDLRNALVCREVVGLLLQQAESTLAENPALANLSEAAREALASLDEA